MTTYSADVRSDRGYQLLRSVHRIFLLLYLSDMQDSLVGNMVFHQPGSVSEMHLSEAFSHGLFLVEEQES